ncbi:MAG TPA: hypothetical protein DCR70_02395 [Phycisphaerales bacterium]|nr:hypothetical protein [Phycisphaerales bacterium]
MAGITGDVCCETVDGGLTDSASLPLRGAPVLALEPRFTPMPYAMETASTTAIPNTIARRSEISKVEGRPGALPTRRGVPAPAIAGEDEEAAGAPGRRINS